LAGLPLLIKFTRGADMRRGTLRHVRLHGNLAGRQFGGDARDTSLDARLDAFLNLLGHVAALLSLLFLVSFHLLNLLLGRHNFIARETDIARDGAEHVGAALHARDFLIHRVVRGLQELNLALAQSLALDRHGDALDADLLLASKDATRIGQHDQIRKLKQRRF
jgi:hypothetical protein